MNTADRIIQRMRALGLKGIDVASRTGVSAGSVSQWRNGQTTPTGEHLFALAEVLSCSPEWILNGSGEQSDGLGLDSSPLGEKPAPSFIDIPVYDVSLAAGAGCFAIEDEVLEHFPISSDMLERNKMRQSDSAIVRVKGDSMEPTLYDKDMILVNTSVKKPVNNKIFAFAFDGDLRVKRFSWQLDRSWLIISDNEDKGRYHNEKLLPQHVENIRIIGQVVSIVERSL